MREKIVTGNWKMNKNFPEGINLIQEIIEKGNSTPNVKIIVAPPFLFQYEAFNLLKNTLIGLAAQNCSEQENGAFTGEISAQMLKSAGTQYIILGHSERRSYYHETDQVINLKIKQTLKYDLKPIVCCGELLEEREKNEHFHVIKKQLNGMFEGLSAEQISKLIIAYEPVWAIGTGKTASPEQAQEIHQYIREIIQNLFGSVVAQNISILYGGSCKPSNAKELFEKPDIDGGLIGGASLVADDFIAIAKSF